MKIGNKTAIFITIILLVILLGIALRILNSTGEEDTIKVGAIFQETGIGATWGEKAIQGVKLAVEKINHEGGINGKNIEIIFEDSESKTSTAISAMNKLINIDKVNFVLSQQSSVVVALSSFANENKVILMDIGATTPVYISPEDYTFRVSYSASVFAKEISNILKEEGIKKVGLLYVNNDYGLGMLNTYREVFDGTIIAQGFGEGDTDFKTQIQKIKNSNPDVIVYTSGSPQQAGVIIKQIKELDLTQPVYTDIYSIEYKEVIDIARESADGVIYASQLYDLEKEDLNFKEFNNNFKEKYGEVSNPLSAQAYDGVLVLAQAMKRCEDPRDTKCIKEELFSLSFKGVIGEIKFDRYGEVIKRPTTLKIVRNGKFEVLNG